MKLAPPLTLTTASLLLCLPGVSAWGALGHDTVAYIATNFVSPATTTYFQTILGDTTSDYLANVATWADSYRYTSAGRFSAPYHFLDANDSPPTSCGVSEARDCGANGCVTAAINNYTARVLDTKLSASERTTAAKFIVHFLGDIHQPLHVENLDVGGNTIAVTFSGVATNLHAIWDTNMPEKLVGGYALADAQAWAANLTADIRTGAYKSQAASWLTGMTLSSPTNSSLIWAAEANKFVCSTVLKGGVAAVSGQELSGAYYTAAVPVFELQIARAGYRLAAWLDLIATGKK